MAVATAMTVTLPPGPLSSDERYLLEQVSDVFRDEIGSKSSAFVRVRWDREADTRGRTYYRLSISDPWADEVGTNFAPDELTNQLHLRYRLYRLWGDLLQRQNDKQHERLLTASLPTLDEEV